MPNNGLTPVQRVSANKLPADASSGGGRAGPGKPNCLAWQRGRNELRMEGLKGLILDSESIGESGEKESGPNGENVLVGEDGRLSGGVCIPN